MSERSLLDFFRSRWQEIARQFWPETPREQLQTALARLHAELELRQNDLLHLRKQVDKLHYRLKRREHRLAQLATPVQRTPMDDDVSAELNCQQRSIDRLRERLQECERGYARRLARWRQRKQKYTELHERLLFGSLPKPREEENDPDYPF